MAARETIITINHFTNKFVWHLARYIISLPSPQWQREKYVWWVQRCSSSWWWWWGLRTLIYHQVHGQLALLTCWIKLRMITALIPKLLFLYLSQRKFFGIRLFVVGFPLQCPGVAINLQASESNSKSRAWLLLASQEWKANDWWMCASMWNKPFGSSLMPNREHCWRRWRR